jgi:hypothetical protein
VTNPEANPTRNVICGDGYGNFICDDGNGGLIFLADDEDSNPDEAMKFFRQMALAYPAAGIVGGQASEERPVNGEPEK